VNAAGQIEGSGAGQHGQEVAAGQRFEFGANWARFLGTLDEGRIREAEKSLAAMLGVTTLAGRTFLDVGCGSGLFSLAAWRLGARVHSFDYDPKSVACARELHRRFAGKGGPEWRIEEASVLDKSYIGSLGQYDVVYSWGVLHHTGHMWPALTAVSDLVKPGGSLFIAIYNDQGKTSRRWTTVKKAYNRLPPPLRFLVLWPAFWHLWWRRLAKDVLLGQPGKSWREYRQLRGMSAWWDVVDWVGGYPFEVAKPEEIFDFYRQRGYHLERLRTEGGSLGCNEFVFQRSAVAPPGQGTARS